MVILERVEIWLFEAPRWQPPPVSIKDRVVLALVSKF
jgi:hypothetical protein